jgi:hypothetical protein
MIMPPQSPAAGVWPEYTISLVKMIGWVGVPTAWIFAPLSIIKVPIEEVPTDGLLPYTVIPGWIVSSAPA